MVGFIFVFHLVYNGSDQTSVDSHGYLQTIDDVNMYGFEVETKKINQNSFN